ncbi:hypothetical protein BJ508DRAFT_322864 [Ascobolus immersus RN42]|uniref:Uncharacterized protein n=1 Tax=Ascobolus immersus RN42 TaxID=1160509 RepID=A0A3N4IK21_ASCIM|nr:hypothetical protein BJ508DRAFT_322864 [Ascobolus immersus RN42]
MPIPMQRGGGTSENQGENKREEEAIEPVPMRGEARKEATPERVRTLDPKLTVFGEVGFPQVLAPDSGSRVRHFGPLEFHQRPTPTPSTTQRPREAVKKVSGIVGFPQVLAFNTLDSSSFINDHANAIHDTVPDGKRKEGLKNWFLQDLAPVTPDILDPR